MSRPIRILIAEDSPADAELILRALRHAGFEPEWHRVDTEADYLASLNPGLDIVLSDYEMPQFSGPRALELLKRRGLDVPFIIISGTIGEDVAVEVMRLGATDYLLKDRLTRLGTAVEHALEETRLRRERKETGAELRATHAQLQHLLDSSPVVIYGVKIEGEKLIPRVVSENITRLLGFTTTEVLSYDWWLGQLHPDDRERAIASLSEALTLNASRTEYRLRHKDGSYRWVDDSRRLVRDIIGNPIEFVGVWSDITERKRAEEVLSGASSQQTNRQKIRVRIELAIVFGISALSAFIFNITNALEKPFQELLRRNLIDDDIVGTLSVLVIGMAIFSYRRWQDSVNRESHEQHIRGALRTLNAELDTRVQQRTAELTKTNEVLRSEVGERQRAEEALRLFRKLVDQSNDAFEVIDPDTARILDVNTKGIVELGYSREEYLSLRLFDFAPSVDESTWPQLAERIRANGHLSGEGLHRRKDGTTFPIEFNAKWVHLDRDYIVTVVRDVTDRQRAEIVLRESERRFREMLENIQLLAMTLDRNGTVTFCNDHLLKVTGWRREEVIGANWFSTFIPEDNLEIEKVFFETVEEGEIPTHYENPIKTKTGELREIVWNNTLLRDGDGDVAGTASIGDDVTERRLVQQRVREQARMLDHAHDAIIVRDIHTRNITFWNQGAERLYGWTADEAKGRDAGELIFADRNMPDIVTKQLLETGEWHGEHQHVTKDGRELIVSSHSTLVRDPDGNPKSSLVINIDITDQKSLEQQFLRAQRMESVGTLASGIAHDLNNILSPILMSAPMLLEEISPEMRETLVSTIETSAQRGADIVRQVLTFARGDQGSRLLVQPLHLMKEMTHIAQETFPKNITITLRYSQGVWTVEADPTQLHQVLLNLCVNARDALPQGGSIILSAENVTVDEECAGAFPGAHAGPHVLIKVTDTGTGIPAGIVDRIFDPFFTTKELGKGTGLGLSTVMGIVKSHRGLLTVDTGPGRGTTFNIYLPAVVDADADGAESAAPAVPRGNGELILVVDDEQNVLGLTQAILEKNGYKVILAQESTEGLSLFAQQMNDIDLVLTDLMMPYMDGFTLIRTMQRMKVSMKFIAFTGYAEATREAELTALGVPICLTKPFNNEKLLAAVHAGIHGKPLGG